MIYSLRELQILKKCTEMTNLKYDMTIDVLLSIVLLSHQSGLINCDPVCSWDQLTAKFHSYTYIPQSGRDVDVNEYSKCYFLKNYRRVISLNKKIPKQ